ncbi:MAG TPA: PHP domain-containing protein [Candidatus Brocadiia bacterium]|nr:PHP domain-containing protein [Candidatus Brocadiia bacterium]
MTSQPAADPLLSHDIHTHTEFAPCAEGVTLEGVARRAREAGIRLLCITEHSRHLYAPEGGPPEGYRAAFIIPGFLDRQRSAGQWRVPQFIRTASAYRSENVWVGMEVDVDFDGELIIHDDVFEQLDIVVAAVHLLPERMAKEPRAEALTDEYIRVTCKALEKDVDVLAHPTRILKHTYVPVTERAIVPVLDAAAANGVALEINRHSLDPDDYFIRGALERGIKLAIGSDAHKLEEMADFGFARKVLEGAGVNPAEAGKHLFTPKRRRTLAHPQSVS